MLNMTISDRIKRAVRVNESTGCWEWSQARGRGGYGVMSIGNKQHYVHRVAYMLRLGGIPEGLWVLHRCDNPCCCNPDHLFLGTPKDNSADRNAKGRQAKGEACWRGRRPFKGSQNPRAKLDEEKAAKIRLEYSGGGVRLKDLGGKYGVSIQSIWKIVKGHRYQPEKANA